MMPPKMPTECNLCGGEVEYISNRRIYGRSIGSGKCYRCKACGAYVGTHVPRPKEALGVLSDDRMRTGKTFCHLLFDKRWKSARNKRKARTREYEWLAEKMGIPVCECHFGYFDLEQLRRAYKILKDDELRRYEELRSGEYLEGRDGREGSGEKVIDNGGR